MKASTKKSIWSKFNAPSPVYTSSSFTFPCYEHDQFEIEGKLLSNSNENSNENELQTITNSPKSQIYIQNKNKKFKLKEIDLQSLTADRQISKMNLTHHKLREFQEEQVV